MLAHVIQRSACAAVSAIMLGTMPLAAQQPSAVPSSPSSPSLPSPLVALRGTLRQLVTIQEKHFAEKGRYSDNLDALRAIGFSAPAKVDVKLLEAKANAWSAYATHADVAGASCVDWVGRPGEVAVPKTALDARAGREGEPTCDAAVAVVENRQISEIAAGLRNLVTAQEKYWMDHGSYTTDLSALGLYPPPKGQRPAALPQVIFAGSRGWSGIAVNRQLRKSCVIYVGSPDELPFIPRTERDRLVASNEGEPVCERP